MSSEATNNNVQKMASAIDDLLYMGAIKFRDIGSEKPSETAILSTQSVNYCIKTHGRLEYKGTQQR